MSVRYQIQKLIGEGGMGRVYLAWDRDNARQVALKTLHVSQDPGGLADEFRLLTRLSHPHLVEIYDFHPEGREVCDSSELHGPCFAMEYVQGRPSDEVDSTRSWAGKKWAIWLAQLASGLSYLHSRKVLHHDLKPSNLLWQDDGRLRILDFGLSTTEQDEGGFKKNQPSGTITYLPPEAFWGDYETRSDLFSAGVVLYQILTGRLPYTPWPPTAGYSPSETVSPGKYREGLPDYLESLLLRLIKPSPSDRPSSAQAVLLYLERHGISLSHKETREARTSLPTRLAWQKPEEIFASVSLALRAHPSSAAASVLVLKGPTGSGRSRFLEEMRWKFQIEGADWIRLKPGPPGSWLETTPGAKEGKSNVSFPEALDAWLLRVRSRGSIVALEDLHEWPEASLKEILVFIDRFLQSPSSARLILDWNRDWESSVLEPISRFLVQRSSLSFTLPPLNDSQSEALLRSVPIEMAVPKAWMQNWIRASGGRPLLLIEALRRGLESNFSETAEGFRAPENLQESCKQSLASLSMAARNLFAMLLVETHPVPGKLIRELWPVSWGNLEDALLQIDQKALIRAGERHEPLALAHPSLRTSYLEYLDETLLKASHQLWLDQLLKNPPALPESTPVSATIAVHALGAKQIPLAKTWGLAAAAYSEGKADHRAALEWYCRLLPHAETAEERYVIHGSMAPLYYSLGRFPEARSAYEKWIQERPDDATQLQKAKFLLYSSMTDFSAGNLVQARAGFEACLQVGPLGRYSTHHPYHVRALNYLAAIEQKAGDIPKARVYLQQALDFSGDQAVLRGEIEQRLGELEFSQLNMSKAFEHFRGCLSYFQKAERPQAEALALQLLAQWALEYGNAPQALQLIEQAIRFSQQGGDPLQRARYLENRALIQMDLGTYGEAWTDLQGAQGFLEVYGNEDDRHLRLLHHADFHLRSGNRDRAAEFEKRIQEAWPVFERRGWGATLLFHQGEEAWHRRNFETALKNWQAALLEEKTPRLALKIHLALCRAHALSGNLSEAIPDWREAMALLADVATPMASLWREVLSLWAREPGTWLPVLPSLLPKIGALDMPELRMEIKFIFALCLARAGLRKSAESFWESHGNDWRAIAAALPEELRMDFENNQPPASLDEQIHQIMNRAESRLGTHPPAKETAPLAPVPMGSNTTPIAGTVISEQRFRQFSEILRQISQRHQLNEILERVMDAAIEFTGAERGFLLLENPLAKGGPLPGFEIKAARHINQKNLGGEDLQVSMSAVREAMAKGSTLLTANAQLDERLRQQRSVAQYQLKSIVAVPLELEGQIFGAIYLDHRYAPGTFGEEDIIFLGAFASQAALALQKAKLLAELREANALLSEKVIKHEERIEFLSGELAQVRDQLRYGYEEIIGQSPKMMEIFHVLDHITDTLIPVWIFGESGTGKELIARSLHANSARKKGPFITINVSAIPETLLESELFGHKKGSFTHADRDRAGLFEQANGGTLFMDEVADMSMNMQAKLLRVLQEGELRPVGANKTVKIDARLVTASNKDLQLLVSEGKFRQDLFFRVNGITIQLPALRDRKEDIPLLVNHLIEKLAKNLKLESSKLSEKSYQKLIEYSWPGNIRQLESVLRNAMVFAQGREITPNLINLPDEEEPLDFFGKPAKKTLKSKEKMEDRRLILEALRRNSLDKPATAKDLGITLRCLYLRMDRYGIPKKMTVLAKFLGMKS